MTDTLGVRILHSCDKGGNSVELNILAGEELSMLRYLRTESLGDRRSFGLNERVFGGRRYGGYGTSGGVGVRWSTGDIIKAELAVGEDCGEGALENFEEKAS